MMKKILKKMGYSDRAIKELGEYKIWIIERLADKLLSEKVEKFLLFLFATEVIVGLTTIICFNIYIAHYEKMIEESERERIMLKLVAEKIEEEQIQYENVEFVQKAAIIETVVNYVPTEEERQMADLVAFGEAGIEDSLGQTLVINVAINNMRKDGYDNLISEFNAKNRYSSVVDGKVFIGNDKEYQVTEKDISESLKEAVDKAFEKDYSEELLRAEAIAQGLKDTKYYEGGACYFYNPSIVSEEQIKLREPIEVKFQHGNHIFYRFWNQ